MPFSDYRPVEISCVAAQERLDLEALADERELICAVDAATRLLRNAASDLRHHRAVKGQQIINHTDVDYGLVAEALLQLELLNRDAG